MWGCLIVSWVAGKYCAFAKLIVEGVFEWLVDLMVGSSNVKVLERLLDLSVFDFLRPRLMVSLSSRSCTYIDSSLKLDGAKRAVAVGDKLITLRLTPFRIFRVVGVRMQAGW